MRLIQIFSSAFLVIAAPAGWADLTIRQSVDFKLGSMFPASLSEQLKRNVPSEFLNGLSYRIKGEKICSAFGPEATIFDFGKNQITILNPKGKRFATVPLTDYPAALLPAGQSFPPQAQKLLENLKIDAQTRKTDRTGMIRGIRAEEYETIISIEIPAQQGVPAMSLKFEIQAWIASPDEFKRIPALQEYAGYSERVKKAMDPVEFLRKAFAQVPGIAEKFRAPLEELMKISGSLPLKMHAGVYAPTLLRAMLQLPREEGSPAPAALDLQAPLAEFSIELAEISVDPVPDAVFQVPPDYQATTLEEVMKPGSSEVHRVGDGVSAPSVVFRREPEYTEEANQAKVQGTVVLNIVVGEDGVPRDMRVVHSLRPDLDQKALEAVREWRFQPGQRDGKPVAVAATIEVNFRLLKTPPPQ